MLNALCAELSFSAPADAVLAAPVCRLPQIGASFSEGFWLMLRKVRHAFGYESKTSCAALVQLPRIMEEALHLQPRTPILPCLPHWACVIRI